MRSSLGYWIGSKISTKSALADTLERIVTGRTKVNALHELMPWEWKASQAVQGAKAAA
jgi:transposase